MVSSRRRWRGLVGALLSVAIMFLVELPVWAEPKVTIATVPSAAVVQPGEEFSVDVVIDTSVPIRSGQCALVFDPNLVEVLGVEEGGLLKDWAAPQGAETLLFPEPKIDNVAGRVEVVSINIMSIQVMGGPTGKGVFVTYRMRAKPGVTGSSPLTLTDVILGDELVNQIPEADVAIQSGQVGVGVEPVAVVAQPRAPARAAGRSLPLELIIGAGGAAVLLAGIAFVVLRGR